MTPSRCHAASRPYRHRVSVMVNRLWLVGIIIAIPLFGLAMSESLQLHLDAELRLLFWEQQPEWIAARSERVTSAQLCALEDAAATALCTTAHALDWTSLIALASGLTGILLMFSIWLAGQVARRNRQLLLYVFKPGLYITALTLMGLIIANAVVIVGTVYYGGVALLGFLHIFIILAISIGAGLGVLKIALCLLSLIRSAESYVVGVAVRPEQQPVIWQHVNSLADRIGALRPNNIVVGLTPDFFVTEANVICHDGTLTGRTLYCSLPLSRILTIDEFSAVVGHELGHFKGRDTQFSKSFYPIYKGLALSIESLQDVEQGGASSTLVLLPALVLLVYFLECFSVAEREISRDRELAADQIGASVTSPRIAATALVKICAFAGIWNDIHEYLVAGLRQGKVTPNASRAFADRVVTQTSYESLAGIDEVRLNHPTDSHPPLSARLAALRFSVADVAYPALATTPVVPALVLLDNAEYQEELLSRDYQAVLALLYEIDLN